MNYKAVAMALLMMSYCASTQAYFLIFGNDFVETVLETGTFNCSECERRQQYEMVESREFVTFFFIPILPSDGITKYVQCKECNNRFLCGCLKRGGRPKRNAPKNKRRLKSIGLLSRVYAFIRKQLSDLSVA